MDHPILRCLTLGVAIHHGALPTAFRKEVERLLRDGVLKVTVSSPTLAQGLNLSATVVIIHSLFRNRNRIETSEFKNVIGRAGRAYVDVEGLVLYPIYDEAARRLRQWENLIDDLGAREMESGLVRLLLKLLVRMYGHIGRGSLDKLVDYVVNNAAAWVFPEIPGEKPEDREQALQAWKRHVATLDTAILSLIGENDISDDRVIDTLDSVLQSSLWERSLQRRSSAEQKLMKTALAKRSQLIWSQSTAARRRGYFLAGLGLESGQALDALAAECNDLLVTANAAVLTSHVEAAITAITTIAERVFEFYPFTPDLIVANWKAVLRCWLLGQPLTSVAAGQEADMLQFVEGGLVYRLPWAMEAIRVRGIANADAIGDFGTRLNDFELGLAVPAVETGTLNRSASILIQAGFSSRLAAIKAVTDTGATFSTSSELHQWLISEAVATWSEVPDWPTPETRAMWLAFIQGFTPRENSTWAARRYWSRVTWAPGAAPVPGMPVRLFHLDGKPVVLSADGLPIGELNAPLNSYLRGLVRASVMAEPAKVSLTYLGPDDLWRV